MNPLLYIGAAFWLLGYGFVVYLYFTPCRRECDSHIVTTDASGRVIRGLPARSVRSAFFELAAAFFFVPLVLLLLLGEVLRARRAARQDQDAR
jgi:hypothetical protein